MRALKWLIGLILLPACAGVTLHLVHVLRDLLPAAGGSGLAAGVWALLAGFGLWLVLYHVCPRPMRTYVLAHELTHALWGWAMGARILGMKVGRSGGHVRLTHANFLITLAPYFFPLYTVLIIVLHAVLSLFYDMRQFELVWLGWVGLTWGFHLTFTLSMLRIGQPDIEEHGRLFSYCIIYLFNLLGIGLWVVAVSRVTGGEWAGSLFEQVLDTYYALIDAVAAAINARQ
jgi:hypothetical protein